MKKLCSHLGIIGLLAAFSFAGAQTAFADNVLPREGGNLASCARLGKGPHEKNIENIIYVCETAFSEMTLQEKIEKLTERQRRYASCFRIYLPTKDRTGERQCLAKAVYLTVTGVPLQLPVIHSNGKPGIDLAQ